MARILSLPNVEGLILDLDLTLYDNREYTKACDLSEVKALSRAWAVSEDDALARFTAARENLSVELGHKASRNETVASLGFSLDWWNEVRTSGFCPEKFLCVNPRLVETLRRISERYKVSIASNSPTPIVHRVLETLGLGDLKNGWMVLGTNDAMPKPSSELYRMAAQLLGLRFDKCLSIGDREEMDGWPAMRLGMGAIIIDDVDDLIGLLENLLEVAEFRENNFDISRLLNLYRPGQVDFCGFTGQAGAGKTTNAHLTERVANQLLIPTVQLSLDVFFRKSSKARKAWLEEGKALGPEEYAARADQMSWWNFEQFEEVLHDLRSGRSVTLRNVYNREDGGELTGTVNLDVPDKGLVVICEGVAIAHMSDYFSHLVYLHARPEVRASRLQKRDAHRRGPEAAERFKLTEAFERRYFGEHLSRADMFVDTSDAVPYIMKEPPAITTL